MDIQFVHEGVPAELPDGVGINLFRVLQEAVTNAIKHSGASWYRVSLKRIDQDLQLEVVDNGHGFDVATALATSGLGLVSMQERLRLVNGEFAVESKPGSGTVIRALVPLQPDLVTTRRRSG